MAFGVYELKLDLEGCVTEQTGELSFGFDLLRHKVKKKDLKGSYILRNGAGLGHYEYIFVGKSFDRG